MALATGQITIFDFTDLPSLQGYLTSNQSKMQFLNTAGTVYSPDWTQAPNLKISAELYAVGSGINIIEDSRITGITWYKNGVEITASGGGITLVPTVTGNLLNTSITINQNLLTPGAPVLRIGCMIMYKHVSTVDATPVKLDIDYGLSQQGATGGGGAAGVNAITIILSNEGVSVPADKTGAVTSYTGTPTTIRVFEGATELIYDNAGLTNSTWKVVAAGTGITPGTIVDSGNFATTNVASAMTATSAKIVYTITGKRADGTSLGTLTKEQSFARSDTGLSGADAIAIDLSGPQVFKYDTKGLNVQPTSITVTSARKNIAGTTYTWTYGLDGATPSTALNTTNFPGVTFGTDTATITHDSSGWGTAKSITLKAVNGAASDTFTIYKVTDGASAYNLALETTSNTMTFDYLGVASPTAQTITLTATLSNIPDALSFAGVWTTAAGVDTAVTAGDIVGSGTTRTFAIAKWPATAVRIKFTATAGAYSDSVTVIKVQEAANAISGYLTNESITLGCDVNGNVIGTIATLTAGTFKAFFGTTALVTPAVGFLKEGTEVGCTATINATTGAYSVSAITADTATVSFRATHVASGAFIIKTLTLSKSKTGAQGNQGNPGNDAITVSLWAPLGEIFKNIGGVITPANLTLQADLYKGGTLTTAGVTYAWFIQTGTASDDGAGVGWDIINVTTPFGCTGYGTTTLTVPASAVTSFENFKCKVTYATLNYYATISLSDLTDPYQVHVQSNLGTTFFNGGGTSKTLKGVVYQAGTVVDTFGTVFAYSWSKWVNGALVGAAGSAGSTQSIVVAAIDVATEALYTCDIDYK